MATWLNINGTVFFPKQHRVSNETIHNLVNDFIESIAIEDKFGFDILESNILKQQFDFTDKVEKTFKIPTGLVFRIEERSPEIESSEMVIAQIEQFILKIINKFGHLVDFNFHVYGTNDFNKNYQVFSKFNEIKVISY